MASLSVRTGITFSPLGIRLTASAQFSAGNKNIVAPAFLAPIIFCLMPPIDPTSPVVVIVPVTAICLPAANSPGVNRS